MNRLKKVGFFWNRPQYAAYLFIIPAFLVIFLFSVVPLFASFVISTLDVTTYFSDVSFVKLDNFREVFMDRNFRNSWRVTGLFTLFDVPINMAFALLIATLVSKVEGRNKVFRSIFILPIICSATVTGLMWKLFLNPTIGWGVLFMERFGLPKLAIFSDIKLAIGGVIFISIWRGFGMTSLILVAAMQGVSESLYEAAKLDGANRWNQFVHVTIPGIISTLWFVFITRIIGSFQVFDLVYTITNGGPARSTETVVSYIYSVAFQKSNRLGYATAMSEVLFAVILLITIFMYSRMLKGESKGGAGQ